MSEPSPDNSTYDDEIDLLDYVKVLIKRRRMLARNTFIAAVAMAAISLILPSTWTATSTLLPPEEAEGQGLQSLLANSPISFLDLPAMGGTTSEIFVEVLKSRTVAERLLEREFEYDGEKQKLMQIFGTGSKEEAVKSLRQSSRISANDQGIVQISVETDDPELAARIANAYYQELDAVNKKKSVSRAKNSRVYIEQQLKQTEQKLEQASSALARFQEKFKAVNLEEQTKVAIEKVGEIKGKIIAKEVELQVAMQTMKASNPIILRLQAEIDELKKQFEHLQFGNSVPFEEQRDYFIPFSDVPGIGLRYAELIREVKVQETVWQLLNQQYYSAKIQEARDTPTVQVLDEAVPPERRTSPKRTLLVIIAATLAFCFSVFGAFVLEYVDKVKQRPGEYEKLQGIAAPLKQDYLLLKQKIKTISRRIRNS